MSVKVSFPALIEIDLDRPKRVKINIDSRKGDFVLRETLYATNPLNIDCILDQLSAGLQGKETNYQKCVKERGK